MNMKFSLGERVIVRNKTSLGEVMQIKQEVNVLYTHTITKTRYLIKFAPSNSDWFEEEYISSSDEMSKDMLIDINKMLIDAHLKEGNYDMVKQLNDEINEIDRS